MAGKAGWSVAGERLTIKPGFGGGKLLSDGVERLSLKSKGEFPVEIAGRAYKLKREAGLLGVKDELVDAHGRAVPQTLEHIVPVPAKDGARCATHVERPALLTCPRCGNFACDPCRAADLTHCISCALVLKSQAKERAEVLMFMAPAIVFALAGGLIGGLLGGAAGGAAVAVAKQTKVKPVRWLAAIGFYAVAVVGYVILAGLLHRSTQ